VRAARAALVPLRLYGSGFVGQFAENIVKQAAGRDGRIFDEIESIRRSSLSQARSSLSRHGCVFVPINYEESVSNTKI
jgi:hypothetical protein